MTPAKTYLEIAAENERLSMQLDEAMETIHAIRTGQVDALVVEGARGHELYTLKTADQTYRVFIEKMNEGAVTLNAEGLILYCNSMFAELVQVPLFKVIGLPFGNFIAADHGADYASLFEKGWTQDAKVETEIISASGLVPCQLSVTTLVLDEGISMSVIVTDLSVQKEAQRMLTLNNLQLEETNDALAASNHDLQQFASVASHDLQEPLRKILVFSDMLRTQLNGSHSTIIATYLEKISNSAARMKAMVSDILEYSRLSTDNYTYELTDLKELAEEVADDFEFMIAEKKAIIHISDLPRAEVNRGQIRQVFQNLISNALKFSRGGIAPRIEITSVPAAAPDEHHVAIAIADNGIGFESQYSQKIFAIFQRLNTKDKYEGSGIGLAIARKIIDKHNGRISVASEPDKGARFLIILPRRQS